MAISLSTRAGLALEAIERLGLDDVTAQEAIEEIVHKITDVVDTDAFFGSATDPDTGLCLGAGMTHSMSAEVCGPFWEHEFLVPDFNKFVDLTPDSPVGDLRRATGGKLRRSPRYRVLNAVANLEDEVRATFSAGGRTWGTLQLNRFSGGEPFAEEDLEFVRVAAPLAAVVLRRALLEEPAVTDPERGPGVVIIDRHGDVVDATAEAEGWVAELVGRGPGPRTAGAGVHRELVGMLLSGLLNAEVPVRPTRLRTRNGTWLIARASSLAESGQVALVLEPAKASEVAPLVVQAYSLTAREVEVTRLVARGLGTDEIAGRLYLSSHTVRDHLKAIFEKTDVSSRGELTSKLFVERYHARFHEAQSESMERVAARATGEA